MTAIGQATWEVMLSRAKALGEPELRALSPLVVLAPHADDETLGCGGLLSAASDLGLAPRVVFLTDGAASHKGSPTWPRERLVATRKSEALAALAVLGVTSSQARFLEWPDSEPHPPGSDPHTATVASLLAWFEAFSPRSLWAPWAQEAHCDHEAASQLADALVTSFKGRLRRFDFMVWGWAAEALLDGHDQERVWALPCPDPAGRRRRALSQHRTQTLGLITDADWAFLIPPELEALTDRPVEVFLEHR